MSHGRKLKHSGPSSSKPGHASAHCRNASAWSGPGETVSGENGTNCGPGASVVGGIDVVGGSAVAGVACAVGGNAVVCTRRGIASVEVMPISPGAGVVVTATGGTNPKMDGPVVVGGGMVVVAAPRLQIAVLFGVEDSKSSKHCCCSYRCHGKCGSWSVWTNSLHTSLPSPSRIQCVIAA